MARLYNNIELLGNMKLGQRLINVIKPSPIKVGNTWFQEIEPTSFFSEEDLERSVLINLQSLFPEFYAVTFKRKVRNTINGAKNAPDLALIKKDYSEWYIIEVELANHNISHIEEQIHTFYNANYGKDDTDYLIKKDKDIFDAKRLENLICSEEPKLMVIVNSDNSDIKTAVDKFDCALCIFQMFLDKDGNPFYRLDGEYPLIYSEFCFCYLEKTLPFTLKLLDDNQFRDCYGLKDGTLINIAYNNLLTKWQVNIVNKLTFLICQSDKFPLDPSTKRYQLSYNDTLKLFSFSKA